MIRFFDVIFSLVGIVILCPIFVILLIVGYIDTKSPIFCQERMGINKKPFNLFKFRSMNINAKSVATHLASHSDVTNYGKFIRKTKLDEIPQLLNVLVGDMSFVGPRPNLFNQDELIEKREKLGVYMVKPGITGLSQINKIDMSDPKRLAHSDEKMIQNLSVLTYLIYLFKTISGNGFGDRINNK